MPNKCLVLKLGKEKYKFFSSPRRRLSHLQALAWQFPKIKSLCLSGNGEIGAKTTKGALLLDWSPEHRVEMPFYFLSKVIRLGRGRDGSSCSRTTIQVPLLHCSSSPTQPPCPRWHLSTEGKRSPFLKWIQHSKEQMWIFIAFRN